MHFQALSQQPNTKIQISNLILDRQKKSMYTINQYINTNTHFLRRTTTFINHNTLNPLLIPITNENNQNYSQEAILLKSPNQP